MEYYVRFYKKDKSIDSEYFYSRVDDAKKHLASFEDDDSELYDRMELIKYENHEDSILHTLRF